MRKIHLRKKFRFIRFKSKKANIIIVILSILMFGIFYTFRFINKKVIPILLNYAEIETTRIATSIINRAVMEGNAVFNADELFIMTKDETNEIKSVDFNPAIVNKILVNLTENVQKNLLNIQNENEAVIYEIPIGVVYNNALLSNLGPKIPVRLNLVGDILSNIETKITNYGINNALIEIFVSLEVRNQVILPFTSKVVVIKTLIPVALKLTQGTVPKYYINGMSESTPILSIPIE